MNENEMNASQRRAILVGARKYDNTSFDVSMQELRGLAEAMNLSVVSEVIQNVISEDSATYIGSGKVEEIKGMLFTLDADLVIFNNTLTPSQLSNLSHDLETEVLDRTNLILNIFGERARTREARMQVDYAKLKYMLPRLSGLRQNLSRQGGTGGSMSNKGSGETQIELDRRHIEKQMAELRRGLEDLETSRATQRKKRENSGLPLVALVGYTNAGKSTMMNQMIDTFCPDEEKKVFVKNMLFATLDTTVRKITPEGRKDFLLSDTVGFINDLPHDLVKAFRSTLEEALYSDLILEIIDASDPNYQMHMEVTGRTLKELGAGHIPIIYVMNKADRTLPEIPLIHDDTIYLSAKSGAGLPELLDMIEQKLYSGYFTCEMLLPYTDGAVENVLRENAQIIDSKYRDDGIYLKLSLSHELLQRYKKYVML